MVRWTLSTEVVDFGSSRRVESFAYPGILIVESVPSPSDRRQPTALGPPVPRFDRMWVDPKRPSG